MSTLVGGTGIIGQDIFCSFGNGKYTTFEGTEIVAENCLKARVKDLVVEGKTYQNLLNGIRRVNPLWSETDDSYSLDIQTGQPMITHYSTLIKPLTTYTLIINITDYTTGIIHIGMRNNTNDTTIQVASNERQVQGKGVRKVTLTTKDTIVDPYIRIFPRGGVQNTYSISKNMLLLEGNYVNTDIPNSIDGIESVAERENINLLKNVEWYDGFINLNTGEVETSTSYPNAKYSELIEINSNQLYKTNITENINGLRIRLYKADGSFIRNSGTLYSFNGLYQSGINYFSKIRLLVLNAEQYPLPITPYVIANDENINYPYPLKLKVNEEINPINLPIPLRSLPNGVADTIEGDKLVQRVGKVVLNGSENWTESSSYNIIQITLACNHKPQQNVFISNIFNSVGNHDKEGVSFGNSLNLWINKNRLTSPDIRGAKQWLSENPVTIYYELATPIIHDITVPQLSTAKGTNIITTSNNIKPKISMKVKVK